MGDRYLVTRTPDRMLTHWGRVQMDTTYMGMFWGKTLWLVVCVVCGVGSWALNPQRGCGASYGSWSGVSKTCMWSTGQGIPLWIKQHWNGPYEFSSPLIHHNIHANNIHAQSCKKLVLCWISCVKGIYLLFLVLAYSSKLWKYIHMNSNHPRTSRHISNHSIQSLQFQEPIVLSELNRAVLTFQRSLVYYHR